MEVFKAFHKKYHSFPFLPYLLVRVLTALSVWGYRAEQGFHFQLSILQEAWPAGMRTGYANARTASKAHVGQGGRMLNTSVEDCVEDEEELPPI